MRDITADERAARTVAELAALCGGTVEGDGSRTIVGAAALDEAGPEHVSFLAQAKYAPRLAETRAGAVVVGDGVEAPRADLVLVRCADPERAFTQVVLAFAPEVPDLAEGVHPTAVVHPSVDLGADARVGAHVTVGPGAVIGAGCRLHDGCRVGAASRLGAGTILHPNVVLYPHTVVGERCVLHGGVVLGSDGFGFLFDGAAWRKTPQVGHVEVGDDVEIGANTTVDCGRFGPTRIGDGTKVDNLVMIAHNVQVGRGCLILSQVGIAGSTVVEDGVIIAGQVGVAGHVRIGKGARIAGGSGITKSVPAGEEWFGYPAGPSRAKMRSLAAMERAGADFKALERRVAELERALQSQTGGAAAEDRGPSPGEERPARS